jgi:hypothetical protein
MKMSSFGGKSRTNSVKIESYYLLEGKIGIFCQGKHQQNVGRSFVVKLFMRIIRLHKAR